MIQEHRLHEQGTHYTFSEMNLRKQTAQLFYFGVITDFKNKNILSLAIPRLESLSPTYAVEVMFS